MKHNATINTTFFGHMRTLIFSLAYSYCGDNIFCAFCQTFSFREVTQDYIKKITPHKRRGDSKTSSIAPNGRAALLEKDAPDHGDDKEQEEKKQSEQKLGHQCAEDNYYGDPNAE